MIYLLLCCVWSMEADTYVLLAAIGGWRLPQMSQCCITANGGWRPTWRSTCLMSCCCCRRLEAFIDDPPAVLMPLEARRPSQMICLLSRCDWKLDVPIMIYMPLLEAEGSLG